MREIGSHDLEAKLAELNEMELHTAFKAMVGCDGKIIFPAIDAKTYGEDRFEEKRRIIELKKDVVIKLAKEFDLDASPLFEALNIPMENVIKEFCKDFNMTYSQLAKAIGYKTDTINKAASTGNISEQIRRAIELYEDNITLRNSIDEYFQLKAMLKNMIK